MKKMKMLNVFIFSIIGIIILNISLFHISSTKAQVNSSIESGQELTSNNNATSNIEEEINLTRPVEIVEYSLNKIRHAVNYKSEFLGKINIEGGPFTVPAKIIGYSTVNKDGLIYSTDIFYMYNSLFNWKVGFAYYNREDNDLVYFRETQNVNTDTGVAEFMGEYAKRSKSSVIDEYGTINFNILVDINSSIVKRVEKFEKTQTGYTIKLRIDKNSVGDLQQKIKRYAWLDKKPSVISLYATYNIDLYGKLLDASFDLVAYGVKKTVFGTFEGTFTGSFYQTVTYSNNQDLLVPTAIQF